MRKGTWPRRGSVFQVKGFSPKGGFGASPSHRMLRALGVRGVDRKLVGDLTCTTHPLSGGGDQESLIVTSLGAGVSDRDLSRCCGVHQTVSIPLLWGTFGGVEGLTADSTEQIHKERETKTSRVIVFARNSASSFLP